MKKYLVYILFSVVVLACGQQNRGVTLNKEVIRTQSLLVEVDSTFRSIYSLYQNDILHNEYQYWDHIYQEHVNKLDVIYSSYLTYEKLHGTKKKITINYIVALHTYYTVEMYAWYKQQLSLAGE